MVKKLFIRIVLLSLPLFVIVGIYVILDPFRIIYPMKEYYPDDGSPKNVDYISGEVYLQNSRSKDYDSFIFGSSRSEAFKATRWKRYIHGIPFHFHASCEGVWGISKKLHYLDEHGVKIRNAIVIIDKACLENTSNPDAIVLIKHPAIAGSSWEAFHMKFFKAFVKDFYFYRYILFRFFNGPRKAIMADIGIVTHDKETNDVYYTGQEAEIAHDSVEYYRKLGEQMGDNLTDTLYQESCINKKSADLLENMAVVFKKHATNLKVVISPMSNRKFFNKDDLRFLTKTFGENSVYDFSGISRLTAHEKNYYDYQHYKPVVADSIMHYIYTHKAYNGGKLLRAFPLIAVN